MPRRDSTGPNGRGAKTGGQRGNCPGATSRGMPEDGRGAGRGNRRKRVK